MCEPRQVPALMKGLPLRRRGELHPLKVLKIFHWELWVLRAAKEQVHTCGSLPYFTASAAFLDTIHSRPDQVKQGFKNLNKAGRVRCRAPSLCAGCRGCERRQSTAGPAVSASAPLQRSYVPC